MAQLLRFLSRIPLLENLCVTEIDPHQEPPYVAERVYLNYLKWAALFCKNLSILTSVFDYLSFPTTEKATLHLKSALSPALQTLDESSTTTLQKLVQMLDNASDGSVKALFLGNACVRCWKSKENKPEKRWLRPTLDLDICLNNFSVLDATILKTLHLDQLVRLEIEHGNDSNVWTLIGNLPCLQELTASRGSELGFTKTLCRSNPQTSLYPAFPALLSLTIPLWNLTMASSSSPKKTVGDMLLDGLKLRTMAKLPRIHDLYLGK
ncbi:hypothetical protein H0H92_008119 [Tricholoma furcatifolium]|nr:hypothetical protein H0H92_008119 [Tricholoma furcatifolium]